MKFDGAIDASVVIRAGVYILCWRGAVVYIGQSKACLARIYTHKSARGKKQPAWLPVKGVTFDEVHIIPEPEPERRAELERRLIAQYKPRHNTAHVSLPRPPISINIRGLDFTFTPKIERRV